jgi:heme exporter protein CcmD
VNHWAFVTAAYAVTLIATAALVLWAYAAMRRAERDADKLRSDR